MTFMLLVCSCKKKKDYSLSLCKLYITVYEKYKSSDLLKHLKKCF